MVLHPVVQALYGVVVRLTASQRVPDKRPPVLLHALPQLYVLSISDAVEHLCDAGQARLGQHDAELRVRQQVVEGLVDTILQAE